MISYANKDWSNGCWKFSLASQEQKYILKYFKMENSYIKS